MDPLRWTIAEGWWLASALWRALDPDTSSKTASLLATEHATCRSEFARDSWSRQQAASYSRVGSSASCLPHEADWLYSRSFTPSRSSSSSWCVASILARLNASMARPCTMLYLPSLQVTGYE